jgi:hypothetical protein
MNRDLMRAVWHRHREPLFIASVVQQPSHEDAGALEPAPLSLADPQVNIGTQQK